MNKSVKGVFRAESRLFATPFSLFVYFVTAIFILLAMFYIMSNSFVTQENPDADPLFYQRRLEEIERELEILHNPSLSNEPVINYEGQEEKLLVEKKLILQYLKTGTSEADYVEVYTNWYYIDDGLANAQYKGQSALCGALNAYPVLALSFAAVCLARGVRRIYSLTKGAGSKIKLLCDRSRKQLLFGGMLFDGCTLGIMLIVLSAIRTIFASMGNAKRFYILDGANVIFGNAHELLFSQFIAIFILSAACYCAGAFFTALGKGNFHIGSILSLMITGAIILTGIIVQYCTKDSISWLLAMPVLGISFCFSGFRYFIYYINIVISILIIVCTLYAVYRKTGNNPYDI